jgi:Mce-associated membrane protein
VARRPAAEISGQDRNFEENNTKVGEDMSITALEDAKSSDNDDSDVVEPENRDTDDEESGDRDTDVAPKDLTARAERRISLSVRSLSLGTLILGLIAALGLTTWLYVSADRKFDAQTQQARDNQHAEQVALDYAVRAAVMDYKDLGPWKRALVEGTTAELSKKLSDASNAMEQILLPLEWSSSAKPLAAKVRSHDKGVYVVDAFVSVLTKTVQAAEKLQSTATYSVTIDPSNGWKISDVGGIGQVVGDR